MWALLKELHAEKQRKLPTITGVDSKEAYFAESLKHQGAAELVGIWDEMAEHLQRGINRA